MKFQTILLLFAASSLVLAKPQLSEDEVDETGIVSEPENTSLEQDIPIENSDDVAANDVTNDTQEDDIAENDNLSQDENENPEDDVTDAADVTEGDNLPEDDVAGNDNLPQDGDENPEEDIANDGEKSDDYGDLTGMDESKIDDNEIEDSEDNGNEGEGIDNTGINDTDAQKIGLTNNVNKNNNESKINAMDNGEKSDDDEGNRSDIAGIAVGIAGAAALSSAGIFLWVKRSKRSKVENAPITMENVA